jgi:hypothetical protein
MQFRIDFDERMDREVRRIAEEQLSAALDALKTQPDGRPTAAHMARQAIKRTRSLYRLVAEQWPALARAENKRLRAIAFSLSAMRDAAAIIETTHFLEDRSADMAVMRLRRALEAERAESPRDPTSEKDPLPDAIRGLRHAIAALKSFKRPPKPHKIAERLSQGWLNAGVRSSEALAACADKRFYKPYHMLRKRAQDRVMHASLLHDLWPSAMLAVQRDAKRLSVMLGHERDLYLLAQRLKRHPPALTPGDLAALAALILQERKKLQTEATSLASDIFGKKPKKKEAKALRLLLDHAL